MVTSTSNAPRQAVTARGGGFYIQVGTFGVASNARATAARLSGAGLPVAASGITRNGRNLQIVMAGPFASAGQAQTALGQVRGAGFGDAFIR
jgi:cell division septation protein DedD